MARVFRNSARGWIVPMLMRRLTLFTAFVAFATSAFGQTLREDADAFLRDEMRQQGIVGLSVAIVRPAGVIYQATIGYADLQRALPVSSSTTFPLGTTGQMFLNLAALALAESGRLNLEADADAAFPGVKLRQAMNQTTGLANFLDEDTLKPSAATNFEDAVRAVRNITARKRGAGYSDSNALLVTRAIELATGTPTAQWVRQSLFAPNGMTSTSSSPSGANAIGYRMEGEATVRDPAIFTPIAPLYGAHFVSNLSDMVRWSKTFSTGAGLKRSTWDLAIRPTGGTDFGLALQSGTFDGETKWIGREGGLDGYSSGFIYVPETQTTFIVLCNSGGVDTLSMVQSLSFLVTSDDNAPKD